MVIALNNKNNEIIPFVGLGTYPFQGKTMTNIVKEAVKLGYRLFDTSDDYRGESGIGTAVHELSNKGIIKREDLFLQTKISDNNAYADETLKGLFFNKNSVYMNRHSVEDIVREKVNTSLCEMDTDYLDSLLIHYPFPGFFVEIWKTMIRLKEEGLVRYIGVSNFHERHIDQLIKDTRVCPDINEIYISPIGSKNSLVDYCNRHGILLVTYSPLIDVAKQRIPIEKIKPLMDKYQKSLAQIILRWNIDRGCLPLPKSKNPLRLKENFEVFDFSLTAEEVKLITSLNYDYQYLVESKICPGL